MNKTDILCAFFSRLATLIIVAFLGGGNRVFGISSQPIVPVDGQAATLAVATAIKPTETAGSLALSLLTNKPSEADHKVVIHRDPDEPGVNALLFPATVDVTTKLATEVLVATIERDDVTKDTSAHTATVVGGEEAFGGVIEAVLEASKPRRNMASLINALIDAANDDEDMAEAHLTFEFDQTGDGSLKVYRSATISSTVGAVALVDQEAAPAAASAPSIW